MTLVPVIGLGSGSASGLGSRLKLTVRPLGLEFGLGHAARNPGEELGVQPGRVVLHVSEEMVEDGRVAQLAVVTGPSKAAKSATLGRHQSASHRAASHRPPNGEDAALGPRGQPQASGRASGAVGGRELGHFWPCCRAVRRAWAAPGGSTAPARQTRRSSGGRG